MHELLHAYFDDELDATQRTAFEEHLGQCPECARELAAQRDLRSGLRDGALYHRPPASLAARVRASLPQPNQPSARWPRRQTWLSTAAIVTGLALGLAGLALIVRAPSPEDRL